ncbi:hypothetical protein V8C35DRAFT_291646 [Trichoderma chlorosporum]
MTFPVSSQNKRVSFSQPLKEGDTRLGEDKLRHLLPASFRNGPAWIGTPYNRVQHFLKDDLNIEQLTQVSSHFPILGKATPPSPLHHQQALGLEIFVSERMDTHLLWTKGKIFIKPFPRYLLEPLFWMEYIACPEDCSYTTEFQLLRASGLVRRPPRLMKGKPCEHSKLWKCAMGFVYSYIALIAHESDFQMAKSCKLMPDDLEFAGWKVFVDQVLRSGKIYGQIDERFTYGELNMANLNTVLMFQRPLRDMFQRGDEHGFFRDHSSFVPSVSLHLSAALVSAQARSVVAKLKRNRALVLALMILCGGLWALYSLWSISRPKFDVVG